jgi:hypothetical protein
MAGKMHRSARSGKAAAWAAAAVLAGGLAAAPAAAQEYVLEVRELTGENFFARHVYLCAECTPEQFAGVVPPPGFEKAPAKLFMPAEGTGTPAVPPPGVPAALDLTLDVPGAEFDYIARVLDGALLGFAPGIGPLATAQVERFIQFRYAAGDVVHELTDTSGDRWILFSFALELLPSYDVDALGGLAGLPVPAGWTYSSRVLDEELVIDSGGLATIFAQGLYNSYQRYTPVPEAGTLALLAPALAGLALRARRAGGAPRAD